MPARRSRPVGKKRRKWPLILLAAAPLALVLLIFGLFAVPTGIILSGFYLAWGRQTGMEADDDSD